MNEKILTNRFVSAYSAIENRFYATKIRSSGSRFFLEAASSNDIVPGLYVSPGWIDLHTHINDGFGIFGMPADDIGYRTGVCMLADAGTVGDYTIEGFRKYVEPTIKTNFKLFICISPIGVIFSHEYNVMEYLNVEKTVHTINENRDIICGVKVRIGSEVIRHEGVEPLRLASEAARMTGLPLMVHIGGNPPALRDIEPFLQKGDIVTHCFNSRGKDAWNEDGTPSDVMKTLLDRGIILDVGHGGGSFSFAVCRKAISHPLPGFCISTDLHKFSRQHFVFDMPTTLTKMMGLNMRLEDVMQAVTRLPADILRLDGWCDMSELNNATVFRIEDKTADYQDCDGEMIRLSRKIVPVAVFLNGKLIDLVD